MSQTALFAGATPLLIFVAKATLLLLAAIAATFLLRRSPAGSRHLVWLAALVGVLALPVLSKIPSLQIGILPTEWASATRIDATASAPAMVYAAGVASSAPAPGRAGAPAAVAIAPATPVVAPASVPSDVSPIVPPSLFEMLAIAWAGVALSLVAWLVAGAIQVRRIVANGTELTSSDWTTPLCEVADRLDLEQPPRLVVSDRIEMAFACRALTPTIVLPAAAESWNDDRRRAVLFHELAHVKRHDLVGHTLGRIACALYWFHPLVWTAAKNLRAESEKACDDLVLSCGARPSEYAQHLLDMVTSVRRHGAPVMALPMARKKEFEGRMLAILDPAIRRASPGRAQSAAVIATLGVLSLTVAAVSPASARSASVRLDTPVANQATRDAAALAQTSAAPHAARDPSVRDTSPALDGRIEAKVEQHVERVVTNAVDSTALRSITRSATAFGMQVGAAMSKEAIKSLAKSGLLDGALPTGRQAADTGKIALLARILATDSDAQVRRSAAWALAEANTPAARTALAHALASDADDQVREMSAWALGENGGDDAVNALSNALTHDKNVKVRATAAWALGQDGRARDADALTTAINDADSDVRETAIWAIGQLDLRKAPMSLVNALSDPSPKVRSTVAWTLGQIGDTTATRALARAFESETDVNAKKTYLWAMGQIGDVPTSIIETAIKSNDPEIRRHAVAMLAGNADGWPNPQPRPRPRIRP